MYAERTLGVSRIDLRDDRLGGSGHAPPSRGCSRSLTTSQTLLGHHRALGELGQRDRYPVDAPNTQPDRAGYPNRGSSRAARLEPRGELIERDASSRIRGQLGQVSR